MLRSMTGFGRGTAHGPPGSATVEVRSVNHRFLDPVVRVPRELSGLEAALLGVVKARLARGRVEVHVRVDPAQQAIRVVPDRARFAAWVDAMVQLTGLPADDPGLQRLALDRPGVLREIESEGGEDDTGWSAVVGEALDRALDALIALREGEGAALSGVLEGLLDEIGAHAEAVSEHVGDLARRQRDRLAARMQALVGEGVDPQRLLQEAALQADKADVVEELDRLRTHVQQCRDALVREEAVGRRLEFLAQEMGREVNTLGSKAVDHPVLHRVVDLKAVLERLREQAANVE